MRNLLFAFAVLSGFSFGISAVAATPGVFLDDEAPALFNKAAGASVQEICYRSYCSEVLPAFREPVAVAEHLTKESVIAARGHSRKELTFRPEYRLPASARAELSDYRGSGYDRGHMSPWADASDPDSFSLANIVPQNSDNNRHIWAHIEAAVRHLAISEGEVYVVTGPIFGSSVFMMNGRVAIPVSLYKAVYVPSLGAGAAYVTRNAAGPSYQTVSLSALEKMTHMQVFPSLTEVEKQNSINLPVPRGD